ncbi:peptidylprolyl isomerase [Nevskia sp.]|uniref:peptidylprolyl isomerase n=1 Tax=Nevskia sp. TaxID=1929292 RepID=UPI0025FFF7A9|nr:peptidylprolyl isomerase [Nevskia sp.]
MATSPSASWLREPLLHFLLIGALLFALDQWLLSSKDDLNTIVVTAEVDEEAAQLFESSRGRRPNAEEMQALRQVWLDNEVLYREGLSLGVDRGDSAIRERVIFKALSLIDADLRVPEISDAELRAWFEARRDKYDAPARYDFDEATVSGERSEAAVRAVVARLNEATATDIDAALRVFKGRPYANIVQSYGAEFAAAIDTAPPGVWQALPTKDGWRAMRLNARTASAPASFESLRGPVLQDWRDAIAADLRTAAVRKIASRYSIRNEADSAAK